MGSRLAFTLIELIAVLVVLAVLAGIAVPRYIDYSTRARAAATARSLQLMRGALVAYHRDHGRWPPDVGRRTAPAPLAPYLDPRIWTAATPIGVVWDYENWPTPRFGLARPTIGISIRRGTGVLSSDAAAAMLEVDRLLDDGVANTGRLRSTSFGWILVVAER